MTGTRAQPLKLIPPIHRATHRIGLHIARLRELGVNQPEAHILSHLASSGECTIGQLHAAFAHRRSTLTSVLDRLWKRNLIAREPSREDRRTFLISLTPAGRNLALRLHSELRKIETRVSAAVSARDLAGFGAVLAALEAALGSDEEAE